MRCIVWKLAISGVILITEKFLLSDWVDGNRITNAEYGIIWKIMNFWHDICEVLRLYDYFNELYHSLKSYESWRMV